MSEAKDFKNHLLQDFINKSQMSKSQISRASGISLGLFNKIGDFALKKTPQRQHIIGIGIGLSRPFIDIDQLLQTYGLSPIHQNDIETIIKLAKKFKLSSKIQPLYFDLYMEFIIYMTEIVKGNLFYTGTNIQFLLRSDEEIEWRSKLEKNYATLEIEIRLALTRERRNVLKKNLLNGYSVNFVINQEDLERYIETYEEKYKAPISFLIKNIENILLLLKEYSSYGFYITEIKHPLLFLLKYSNEQKYNHLLFISSDSNSDRKKGLLRGYATTDQLLFNQFDAERKKIESFIIDKYRSHSELQKYFILLLYNKLKATKEELAPLEKIQFT